jgi:hypothetical protein
MEKGVLIDFSWPISLAIASHIGRYRVESSCGEGVQLMTPRIP